MHSLSASADLHEWPLPYKREYDALPVEWKRSGWVGGDDDYLVYTISDHDRGLSLSAIITEVDMDEEEDNKSYTTNEGDGEKEQVKKLDMEKEQAGEQGQHQREEQQRRDALDKEEEEVEGNYPADRQRGRNGRKQVNTRPRMTTR